MAFLDNSGDIILDLVLTDQGRYRLARGDFKITKFALGDEEINYGLYDTSNASGSAYYDLSILQTPILEAFTNNTSTMNTKLLTIARNDLLYLPEMQINDDVSGYETYADGGVFYIATDEESALDLVDTNFMNGYIPRSGRGIRVDQGMNTTALTPAKALETELTERRYIVEMDSRFGKLADTAGKEKEESYIDDDMIASYFVSFGVDPMYVEDIPTSTGANASVSDGDGKPMVFAGPRGTCLKFRISASSELQQSTYNFTRFGGIFDIDGTDYYYIDSTIRVTGATTGYRVDVPVRYVRKV